MPFDKFAEQKRRFRKWTTEKRDDLLATGLPIVTWSTFESWHYFLDHGVLTYDIDPTMFSIDDMTIEQARRLRDLIEPQPGEYEPSILGALRVRAAAGK